MKLFIVKNYNDYYSKTKTEREIPFKNYSKNLNKKETFRIVR
jgi:hypothetical protein